MIYKYAQGSSGGAAAVAFDPTSTAQVFPLFEDFQTYQPGATTGALELFFASNGTATWARNTISAANKGRYGILVGCSGTTTTANATATSGIESFLVGSIQMTFGLSFALANVATTTDNYVTRFGFANTFPGAQHGVYFSSDRSLSTTNWQAITIQGSTQTATDTGIALDTNFHNIKIVIASNGGKADFYFDGVKVATNTTNLPTSAGQNIGAMISQQTGGTGTTQNNFNILYDWILVQYQLSVARGTF